jgi:hypothetical protein
LTPNVTSSGDDSVSTIETAAASTHPRRFYRTTRASLARYDCNGIAGNSFTTTATFTVPGGAMTVARNVVVTYNGGVTRTITNGFTVNGTGLSPPWREAGFPLVQRLAAPSFGPPLPLLHAFSQSYPSS